MPKNRRPFWTHAVRALAITTAVATAPKNRDCTSALCSCASVSPNWINCFLKEETGQHLTRARARSRMDWVTCLDCFDASVFEALLGESVGEENRGHEGEVLALGRLQGRARHKRVPAVGVIGRWALVALETAHCNTRTEIYELKTSVQYKCVHQDHKYL